MPGTFVALAHMSRQKPPQEAPVHPRDPARKPWRVCRVTGSARFRSLRRVAGAYQAGT